MSCSALVMHGEIKAYQVDVDLEGLQGARSGRPGWGLRRAPPGGASGEGATWATPRTVAMHSRAHIKKRPGRNAEDENSWMLDDATWRNDTSERRTKPYNAGSASGNLMSLIVSHKERDGIEDDHEPSRPPGGSCGEAGCLGNSIAVPSCARPRRLWVSRAGVPNTPTPQQADSLGKLTSGMTPGKGTQEAPRIRGPNPPPVFALHGKPARKRRKT